MFFFIKYQKHILQCLIFFVEMKIVSNTAKINATILIWLLTRGISETMSIVCKLFFKVLCNKKNIDGFV